MVVSDSERIVVMAIDDDADDLAILRYHLTCLRELRPTLCVFEDAREGLAKLATSDVDVVLLDYHLAGHTGFEVFEQIRIAGGDHAPVILMTDQGDEEVAVRAMHAGFEDYLPKQKITTKSLRRSITNAIEKGALRRAVRAYREDLEETVGQLETRNAEINSFYHALSHELKTPLTAAREFVSIVLDGLQGPLNAEQRDSLETAKSACDQMTVCMNDMLDVTRAETGKLAIDVRPRGLSELVERAVNYASTEARAKGVRVDSQVDPGLPDALVDESRVLQILGNLIGNALKFTDCGGVVSVHAGADSGEPGMLAVSVQDTGRGIESDKIERVFERLYQASDGDAAIHGGLGLGLSLCRELVRLHGGEISVESEPGRGSTFSFTVPADRDRLQSRKNDKEVQV